MNIKKNTKAADKYFSAVEFRLPFRLVLLHLQLVHFEGEGVINHVPEGKVGLGLLCPEWLHIWRSSSG